MKIYPCFSLLKETRKGFLQLMHASGQLNRKISCFQLLKSLTGLWSFETFYDVIFENVNPPKTFPSKVSFLKYISKINSVIYIFLNIFKVGNILHFLSKFEKKFCRDKQKDLKKLHTADFFKKMF